MRDLAYYEDALGHKSYSVDSYHCDYRSHLMWTFLIWVWRVFTALLVIVIVIGILSNLRDPVSKIVVPILGLIYCTIRSIAIGQALFGQHLIVGLSDELNQIKEALNIPVDREAKATALDSVDRTRNQLYFTSAVVGIIYLICLFALVQSNS